MLQGDILLMGTGSEVSGPRWVVQYGSPKPDLISQMHSKRATEILSNGPFPSEATEGKDKTLPVAR